MEDEDYLPNSRCEDCGSPLINNVAEGTLVCSNPNCCLVHQAGLIDQTKEIRVFAPTETSNQQQMERTGDPVRTEKVNNIRTDFTGNYKKSLKFHHITQTPVDKEE